LRVPSESLLVLLILLNNMPKNDLRTKIMGFGLSGFIYSSDYEELKKYCHNHIKSEFIQEIIERTMSV